MPSSFYERIYLQNHPSNDSQIKVAFENFMECQSEVKKMLGRFSAKDAPITKIAEYVANLFTNDDYVQQEYASGMNLVAIAPMDTRSASPLSGLIEIL